VVAELVTPVANPQELALDGVLSWGALTTHPVGSHFAPEGSVVPLPLELLWVSPEGRPLWAATPLRPLVPGIESREYWHKRYPSHRAEFGHKLNAVTSAGRWKEYRMPVQALSVARLGAWCLGERSEVERLLSPVTHIGKKGSMGYGRVARWTVTPAPEVAAADILAQRPVPLRYWRDHDACPGGRIEPQRGWTPPYWFAPWWEDCLAGV
jgi:hypothetical protein